MNAQRIVVTGATGNIGTAVVRALAADPAVGAITGLVRRPAGDPPPKTEYVRADVARDSLTAALRGADAVVHLAWLFQPTHRPDRTWEANALGSIRVFEAAAEAGVPAVVYASSVGAYSPAAGDRPVAEDWPTHGWPGAAYTREKAYVERCLDAFERAHPAMRVVRVRPGFVFQRSAATEQRRLFGGPLIPGSLVRPGLLPVFPDIPGLRFQVVHSNDLADAIRRCVLRPVFGAFNVATDPVVDSGTLAGLLHARRVPVPPSLVKPLLATAWRMHLVPATPGLFDAVLRLPVMDTSRAQSELDWRSTLTAQETLSEFLRGLRRGAGGGTPPLAPDEHRAHEIATGVGQRP
ncbi:NAD-dependent epimerase/dehydratase family protein [Amycolatopsis jiangsuensis]|uniref:Nucleoside-diphosphate-sugar epimerase n=1 Tax=Amycolatopsis jiangsuensis TaxID=1181879 RepID=A0A840J6X0_9PSEU|nr:NAD-dependent epimerase/dehydratase family protein [Amycolatopsis jiangsuensis]MBB4689154.1 nucleoside-diphosphate-sugar epimerase [Amycolatopsis jiangsuensis]